MAGQIQSGGGRRKGVQAFAREAIRCHFVEGRQSSCPAGRLGAPFKEEPKYPHVQHIGGYIWFQLRDRKRRESFCIREKFRGLSAYINERKQKLGKQQVDNLALRVESEPFGSMYEVYHRTGV